MLDVTDELAIAAIDLVLAKFPLATFRIEDGYGRVWSGEQPLSLAFPIEDPDCELVAWADAGQRLGNGTFSRYIANKLE